MKCLILAAGYATRLYPLTKNYPKSLLEVGGMSILDRLMEDLREDCDGFILVSNHRFFPIFQQWAAEREKIIVLDDGTISNETRLGTVRDIEYALKEYPFEEDVLVMAGDNLLDFSLIGFLDFAREKGTSCVMCHRETDLSALRKTAVITVDEDSRITSYEEKPQEPKGELAVPPFYYYKAEDIRRVSEALKEGCGHDAPGSFAAWLSKRTPMHAYVMPGRRYDIGDLESYEKACRIFAEK